MAGEAMERIARFIESLPAQPASDLDGAEALARSLSGPMPERGAPLGPILDLLFDRAVPKSFNTAGPGYLAYIPGGGLFHAAVADLIADAINRYVGVWHGGAGARAARSQRASAGSARWSATPPRRAASSPRGGSLANLERAGHGAPRAAAGGLPAAARSTSPTRRTTRVQKAALLAGLPASERARGPHRRALPPAARRPRRARSPRTAPRGLQPFLLVASAGTTNTGAVDPLPALADLARREGLWLHVDAAYGGFFVLTERGRRALAGIERADSITLDPHKGLFLPYGTGCLLVRDGEALRRAHALHGRLPAGGCRRTRTWWTSRELSPELSRDFRGLRVWLPLKLHGVGAFRAPLDEKLDLAALGARTSCARSDGLEIVAEPAALAARLPAGAGRDCDEAALDAPQPRPARRGSTRASASTSPAPTLADASCCASACCRSARTGTAWRWRSRTSARRSPSRADRRLRRPGRVRGRRRGRAGGRAVLGLERAGAVGGLKPRDVPCGSLVSTLGGEGEWDPPLSEERIAQARGQMPLQPRGFGDFASTPSLPPVPGEDCHGNDADAAIHDRLRGAIGSGTAIEAPPFCRRHVEEVAPDRRPPGSLAAARR